MKQFSLLCLFLLLPAFGQDPWSLLLHENSTNEARALFESRGLKTDMDKIGWFLSFTADGPTPEVQEAALKVLKMDPQADACEFILKWMENYSDCLSSWEEEAATLLEGVDPKNPELKPLFASLHMAKARYLQEVPDFDKITNDAGFINHWLFSERFGAYALPAFGKTWPAEQPDYWENPTRKLSRTRVIIPPSNLSGKGVIYAFSTFENPIDQDVYVRTFGYQNTTIYIDGKEVGTYRHFEEIAARIGYFKLKLSAGAHEIMVKVSQTRGTNGQFALQLTGEEALSFTAPEKPKHSLSGKWSDVSQPSVGLAAALNENYTDEGIFIRACLANQNKDMQSTFDLLEAIYPKHPDSQLIGGVLATNYLRLVNFKTREESIGTAYQVLSRLMAAEGGPWPENQYTLALLLLRARQTDQALEILNNLTKNYPRYCDGILAHLRLASRETLYDQREQLLTYLEEMGPDHRWAQQELLKEAQSQGNIDKITKLLENLTRLFPWEGYQAQLYEMQEDYQAAIKNLEMRGSVFDDRDYYPYTISTGYARLGDHKSQRLWLEKTLEVNPGNRDAILDLVNLDCLEGKREMALKRLNEYLVYEPSDASFRQRLSHLEGQSTFEKFRVDALNVIEEAKEKPLSDGADAELFLDQLMVRVFPDGSQMRYTHLVKRVLTKDGVDNESEIQLPENTEILQLRTIKADGQIFYPESFENKNTLSLSGIGIGDFIDEEHIEYLPPAYYDSDGLDAYMTFIFQNIDRLYHHSELVLIYPSDLEPKPVLLEKNMPTEATIEEKDGLTYVRWLTVDMPPLKTEPNMPPPGYSQPIASFYYNTTHEEIRDYYLDAVSSRLGLTRELKKQAETWKLEESDPLKLAKKVYEAVADSVEPESQFYKNINLVWETKKGNATLLLAAIYQELGFDCEIALTQNYQMEKLIFKTPLPSFDYVLLRLRIDGETHWIDGNLKGLPFGYVPFPYRGSTAILLNQSETFQAKIPQFDDKSELVSTNYELKYKPDGTVGGEGSEKFYGSFAARLKDRYEALNKPEIKQRVEAGINQNYPGATVTQVEIPTELERGEFELKHSFTLDQLGQMGDEGLTLEFPLPNSTLLDHYGKLATRIYPVNIMEPYINETEMTLIVPKELKWENETELREENSKFGSYRLEITRIDDQTIKIKRQTHLRAQYVMPEDYQEFLVFCRSMIENEDLSFKALRDAR